MLLSEIIKEKIEKSLSIAGVIIEDESYKHEGHPGSRPGGETHFKIKVISESFSGKSRIERQRMIFRALENEMKEKIHAISIAALTPKEFRKD